MLPVMTSTGFTKVYQTNNNSITNNNNSNQQQMQAPSTQGIRLPIFILPTIEANRLKTQQELMKLDQKRQTGGLIAVNFIAYVDIKR